ncbi:MAG TPA: efflux transporter outer membrane subunit [Tepidisphaeraceae bacterium]|nr:efflux transporter outer membrane subunit [Tepidisphaeraceae bacterium]
MIRRIILGLSCLSLASCEVGPNYKRPDQEMPTTYKSATTQESPRPQLSRQWWRLFGDESLDSLEQSALAYNTDIRAAMARVTEARAAAQITGSDLFPTVTLDPSIQRSRAPSNFNNGTNASGGAGGRTNTIIHVPFDLTYEIDIWGRIRRSVEAANATAHASEDDYQLVMQTVEADVAEDYFTIRSLIAQEKILERNVQSFRTQLELTQKQLRAGLLGPTDEYQADAQLEATISQEVETRRQRVDLEHALAILLGRAPSEFDLITTSLDLTPPTIPAGLPADLLRRRPDVAEAEQNLVAANAQIGEAQALFFPTINLSGSAGFESIDVTHSLDWENRIWSIGANAAQPIFEGGRLTAGLNQVKARYEELNATYRGSVLGAIRDVEDSLTDLHLRADEAVAQGKAVHSSREYVRLSDLQYRQGLVSYLQVIDAERTLLQNELTAAQILNERMTSTVLLMKALGGGWDAEHPNQPTTEPVNHDKVTR